MSRTDEIRRQVGDAIWEARLVTARERQAVVERVLAAEASAGSFAAAVRLSAPDVNASTVARWRDLWLSDGLEGLVDRRAGPLTVTTPAPPAQLVLAAVMEPAAQPTEERGTRRRDPRGRKALPLVKWTGGKAAVVPFLLAKTPATFGVYHEPFVGGGSVFFALRARGSVTCAHLADRNAELVNLYCVVRDSPGPLIEALTAYRNTKEHYLAVRGIHPDSLGSVDRAARTLFLNRTCFNGLYRVNRQGLFNVPYGSQQHTTFFQPEALLDAHRALTGVDIACADFATCAEQVQPRDFIYFDPPYVRGLREGPVFARYQADGFSLDDQRRLADLVRQLDARGAFVMVSNSDDELARELYRGFYIDSLSVLRQVGGHVGRRGSAGEIVVRNYE